MNPHFSSSSIRGERNQRGMFLIDCLIYMGMFFTITGVAFTVFYRCWDDSKIVQRTADDISTTLDAGERWRNDVRQTAAPLRIEDSADGQVIVISRASGPVRYRFAHGEIQRQNGDAAPWTPILSRVKSSRMLSDQRQHVAAWRWEVELQPRRKSPRVLPLFTFEAVPGPGANP